MTIHPNLQNLLNKLEKIKELTQLHTDTGKELHGLINSVSGDLDKFAGAAEEQKPEKSKFRLEYFGQYGRMREEIELFPFQGIDRLFCKVNTIFYKNGIDLLTDSEKSSLNSNTATSRTGEEKRDIWDIYIDHPHPQQPQESPAVAGCSHPHFEDVSPGSNLIIKRCLTCAELKYNV